MHKKDDDIVAAPGARPEHSRQAAVALAYRTGQVAPQVVAKGRGLIAEAIIARAKESGVYVHESAELVSLLMQVDIDEYIPPQLYLAVAELLAWLYRLEHEEETAQRDITRHN
ncbi:MAG: EscU/YscU/HrcU family type III secretion system export apparatus switch protein [Burkholderiales bacterium]|nr:EscU/YscU/HrcU family type III secretion system export apparatus switch protein [Burkholderiales bacterium]